MRFEGTLTQWHVERGFGAITPLHGGQALFVHISAFPASSSQPMQNELLSFEVVSGSNGQKQAARVMRPKPTPTFAETALERHRSKRPALKSRRPTLAYAACAVLVLLLSAGALIGLDYSQADGRHVAKLLGHKTAGGTKLAAGASVLR
ncbi:cold shock domain-containing protein [Paucibacter sp. Y2R2-4]|uniref:cold shock domain-containing protein n=1 Tax=Paucibacter sp. Y2R2-4 TaxID=2893553 RepID=UPI0021E4E1B9|nr:cold shock domain-containing protein [Paucibacter sp. Y2R2-4]MCV2350095.1 cold shock domain-containing protein [Paucibacter sp. Y2R2-4]